MDAVWVDNSVTNTDVTELIKQVNKWMTDGECHLEFSDKPGQEAKMIPVVMN